MLIAAPPRPSAMAKRSAAPAGSEPSYGTSTREKGGVVVGMKQRCSVKTGRTFLLAAFVATTLLLGTIDASPPASGPSAATLVRGRALVVFGTCNDCHTPGWRESDGTIPVQRWLTGSSIGFRGWWGTSYPANIRLVFQEMSEARWIAEARTRSGHPPMVWQDLRQLPAADLRAIYEFVTSLGPAGVPVPAAVEPWRAPKTPFVDMRALPSPAP